MIQGYPMSRVSVRFFAGFKERVNKEMVVLSVAEGATLSEVMESIKKMVKGSEDFLDSGTAIIAVNHEVVGKDKKIMDGDEIAIFPPVSGG